jgi:hypothetical protein
VAGRLYVSAAIATCTYIVPLKDQICREEKLTKEFGMKRFVNRMVVLLMVGAMASVLAFGKTSKKDVTFAQSVMVNGTVVKPGTYSVAFDDGTGELTITRDTKVIARTPARLEKQEGNSQVSYETRAGDDSPAGAAVLVSVTFKDRNRATVINAGESKGESAQ